MGVEKGVSLFRQAASSLRWSSLAQGGRQAMQLLATIVLARLLDPSDFGLMTMAMVIVGFVALFKDLGTSAALIQSQKPSRELASSLFWVNAALGALATLVLFLCSAPVADFFKEPRIEPMVKVLSFTFFISGLGILQQALLEKESAFRKLAKLEMTSTAAGAVVGILLAAMGCGVWSLVCQTLVVVASTTALLWTSSRWRPSPIFRWSEVRVVSSYSLHLAGFNVFNYFIRNMDNVLIGRFLGGSSLGYYNMSYRMVFYPVQTLYGMIGRVLFPLYSGIQEDNARFSRVYLRVAGNLALIAFPFMAGLFVLSEPLVLTVFGEKWRFVIPLLMILAPAGLIQSVGVSVGSIYQAKGRTDWMFRWGVGAGLVMIMAFVVGLRWGVLGVAAAYTAAAFGIAYPGFSIPFRLIQLKVRALGEALWRPIVCALFASLMLAALRFFLMVRMAPALVLGVLIPVGVLLYLGLSWRFNRDQMKDLFSVLKPKARA